MNILKPSQVKWQDYRDLRLKALREEQQSFGASYEVEKNNPDEEWQKRWENYKKANGNWMVFAENEGKLIGMVGTWQDEESRRNNIGNVFGTYIVPEERGKGIAKMLLTSLLTELKQNPSLKKARLTVNIDKIPAFHLYKSVGFTGVKGRSETMGDGNKYDVVVMEKDMVK